MNLTTRILLRDLYLVLLVFLRWTATGLGLGVGFFLAAVLLGIFKRVAG